MTNPGDNAPLVPRRSLGKASPSADTATQPSIPAYGLQTGQHAAGQSELASGFGTAPRTATAPPPLQPAPPQPAVDGPATVAPPQRQATEPPRKPRGGSPRTIRRAKLRLVRVDPWSVTKVAFLLSIAFGVMCVVAVFLVFSIMNAAGLWEAVNDSANKIYTQQDGDTFDITQYVGMSRVMGITMLIAAVDVVLITALATLGAFIYNMGASLLGGVEITLAEDIK
jgi:hypothetical protein